MSQGMISVCMFVMVGVFSKGDITFLSAGRIQVLPVRSVRLRVSI